MRHHTEEDIRTLGYADGHRPIRPDAPIWFKVLVTIIAVGPLLYLVCGAIDCLFWELLK